MSKLTGEETKLWQVLRNGKGDRVPPLTPDAFEKLLEEGVASGEIKFTHSSWRASTAPPS